MAVAPTVEGGKSARSISRCTCANVRMLARRVSQIYDQKLAPHGLTIAQFGILARIVANPGIAIGDLAEMMVMDPTTLTRNLAPLRRDDFLTIAFDERDRRRRVLSLTPAGHAIFNEALPAWRDAQKRIADTLGRDGLADLMGTLTRSLDLLAE